MTWPWLVALLLGYALIGAVTAAAAHPHLWTRLMNFGEDSGNLNAYWAYPAAAYVGSLAACLLVGLAWPVTAGAWAIHQKAALR